MSLPHVVSDFDGAANGTTDAITVTLSWVWPVFWQVAFQIRNCLSFRLPPSFRAVFIHVVNSGEPVKGAVGNGREYMLGVDLHKYYGIHLPVMSLDAVRTIIDKQRGISNCPVVSTAPLMRCPQFGHVI